MYKLLFYNPIMLLVMNVLILLALTTTISSEPYGGNYFGYPNTNLNTNSNGGDTISLKCPRQCTCVGQTVDCSHKGLTQVPRKIPLETERL